MYTPNLKKLGDLQKHIPIIVGGMQGSGTRVAVWLLEGSNVYMSYKDYSVYVHEPHDSIPMAAWMVNYFKPWVFGEEVNKKLMVKGFEVALDLHLAHKRDEKIWGWKNPPNMYLLDFYHELFPKMKYIHVIRDGRDTSPHWQTIVVTQDMRKYIPKEMLDNPVGVNYMWFWDLANKRAIEYGREQLKENFLLLRMEDITAAPEAWGKKIQEFVGAESFEMHKVPFIEKPLTIGRHKEIDSETLMHMTVAGKKLLKEMSYIIPREKTMDLKEEAPIIVGGFGGSGTRVPVLYLMALGVDMKYDEGLTFEGKEVYEKLTEFGYKWANDVLRFQLDEEHIADSIAVLDVDKRPWGWKNPTNIFYLEHLHKIIPNMKFIHITRDPRDISMKAMAIWTDMYVRRGIEDEQEGMEEYFKLWSRMNLQAYDYGIKHMGNNYLHVRLEDLLPRSKEALEKFAAFARIDSKIRNKDRWEEISTTHQIGTRIKDRPMPSHLGFALERFGYKE